MLTLDPRRHQPTAREVGHDCADRGALVPCKLSSRGDDVVIDVKCRAHYVMLAHHRIMFDNECRRLSFCSADHAPRDAGQRLWRPIAASRESASAQVDGADERSLLGEVSCTTSPPGAASRCASRAEASRTQPEPSLTPRGQSCPRRRPRGGRPGGARRSAHPIVVLRLEQLDLTAWPRRVRQPCIGGEQDDVEYLSEGDVGGVVDGEVLS